MFLEQCAFLNDTDIANKDDSIEGTIPQIHYLFHHDTKLKFVPFFFEKSKGCEDENLQQQSFLEIFPSAIKQSLNISFFDSLFL